MCQEDRSVVDELDHLLVISNVVACGVVPFHQPSDTSILRQFVKILFLANRRVANG